MSGKERDAQKFRIDPSVLARCSPNSSPFTAPPTPPPPLPGERDPTCAPHTFEDGGRRKTEEGDEK